MTDSSVLLLSISSWIKNEKSVSRVNEIIPRLRASFDYTDNIISKDEKEIVFVITLEESYINNKAHTEFEGLELLKWLRLNKIFNHCILTSFLPFFEIVQSSPKNIIITSRGNSFIQLPNNVVLDKESIRKSYFHANEFEIKQLFRSEIDIAVIRHEEANWWGIYKLAKGYQIIEDKNIGDIVELFPPKLIQILNSYSFQRNLFVFDTLEALDDIEIEEQTLHKNRESREFLREATPKIIYVDDQSDDGWSNILKEIIYQTQIIENFITPEVKDKSVDELYDEIKIPLTNDFIDLIILDLRLKNEKGVINDIDRLSGVQLFDKIKANHRRVPVIIITASNKANTYAGLHSGPMQPDAYWIKEGIDSYFSNTESLNNYFDLVNKIKTKIYDRRGGRLSPPEVKNFENNEERKAAIKRLNDGIDNINYQSLSWMKANLINYKEIEDKLLYNECIIDANYFLYTGANAKDYIQCFILLAYIYKINNQKIRIHLRVYAEIIKYGMMTSSNPKPPTNAARHLFEAIRHLVSEEAIEIIDFDNKNYIDIITGKDIYADDKLVEQVQNSYLTGKSVLFISNDWGNNVSKGPRTILKEWFDINKVYGRKYKITGKDFLFYTMQDMLNDLKRYNRNSI